MMVFIFVGRAFTGAYKIKSEQTQFDATLSLLNLRCRVAFLLVEHFYLVWTKAQFDAWNVIVNYLQN